MKKRWRNIPGFEGYRVSDHGDVKSFTNNRHGICKKSHILKPVKNKHGYDTVCLGRGNRRLVHRLVAEVFNPNPNHYPIVRHLDDNPQNNHFKNLEWGTQTDNMQDCVKHGRLVGDTRAAIEATRMPIRAYTADGEFVGDFASMNEAARSLNLWVQHIHSVLKGKIRQTGGYIFEYIKKEDIRYE